MRYYPWCYQATEERRTYARLQDLVQRGHTLKRCPFAARINFRRG